MYTSNYTHLHTRKHCMCVCVDALEISPCLLLVYHALPRCLKICSPVLLSLALLLTLIACVNVLRGSSPPSTVVIFAVLRFSLLTLKGLTPKRLNVSASPSHTRIQIVQSYVCMYVCMHISTCSSCELAFDVVRFIDFAFFH